MTTSTFRRVLGVLFVALVAALGVASSAVAEAGEVREIRDVVPFGKSDEHFGRASDLPPGIATPPATPLQVRLRASKAPALNEPVTITLQTYSAERAPGTAVSTRLPEGAEVLEGSTEELVDLEAGQTHELTVVAVLTKLGEQTIEGKASRPVNAGETWGDDDALFLTVEKENGFVGHRSGDDAELGAIRVSDDLAGEPRNIRPKQDNHSRAALQGQYVTLEICWTFAQRGSGSPWPLRNARVLFKDEDDPYSGWDDLLASGYTGYQNGCASATVPNDDSDDGGEIDVYAVVFMEHAGQYQITNLADVVFQCKTATTLDVNADLDLGTQQCDAGGGSIGNARAAWIYNDAYLLRRFVEEHRAGKGKPPGECRVKWQTGSTSGTFYRPNDGRVYLNDSDAASRDTVVHECSHSYMHTAYGSWPQVPNCLNHNIPTVSGPECAWTEGYTYVLVAGADGDPLFTWPSGAFVNLETQSNCTNAAWDQGPAVEGRVGGVLIDLMDPFTLSWGTVTGFTNEPYTPANPGPFVANCTGGDDQSGLFSDFWQVFTSQSDAAFVVQGNVTDSFSRAWRAAGHPAGQGLYNQSGQFLCFLGGNCVGGLNTIPTFGID